MSLKSKIEKIILAIQDSNISEIEVTNFWGAQKIKLKTNQILEKASNEKSDLIDNSKANNISPVNTNAEQNDIVDNNIEVEPNNIKEEIQDVNKEYTIINAPLVGTFYQSSKPGDKPFVQVGTKLNIGDPLCIIEAMKIFNTIESEFDGEIKEVFIQDGEPIEYGQALFSIDVS